VDSYLDAGWSSSDGIQCFSSLCRALELSVLGEATSFFSVLTTAVLNSPNNARAAFDIY